MYKKITRTLYKTRNSYTYYAWVISLALLEIEQLIPNEKKKKKKVEDKEKLQHFCS